MTHKDDDGRRRAEAAPIENIGRVDRKKVKHRYSRQLIEETIEVWQPYYDNELTDADACEIIENMSLFAGALLGFRRGFPNRGESSPESD